MRRFTFGYIPGVTPRSSKQRCCSAVGSLLADGYGFDHPYIRGLTKMRLRMTMALTIMLAMALGRIQAGQPEHMRSLLNTA